jgi:hypothetical protein
MPIVFHFKGALAQESSLDVGVSGMAQASILNHI